MEEEWKSLEEGAKERIFRYVSLCALLTYKTPTLRPSGSREIKSINNVEKAPFSVTKSVIKPDPSLLLLQIVSNVNK